MTAVPVLVEADGVTDVGRVRTTNEDQFLIANLSRSMVIEQSSLSVEDQTRLHGVFQGTLFLVADGMGGHQAGEVASRLAVETVVSYVLNTMPWFFRLDEIHGDALKRVLREALEQCEITIRAEQEETGPREMGTTLTMAYVLWPNAYVLHAGDSRCYVIREGRLLQVTRDHTLAQQLVDERGADPRDVDQESLGHVLWNAVGADASRPVAPDVTKVQLSLGDTLLICSDGLHGPVPGPRISQIIVGARSTREASEALVAEANRRGGHDNVTAVVARFRPVEP